MTLSTFTIACSFSALKAVTPATKLFWETISFFIKDNYSLDSRNLSRNTLFMKVMQVAWKLTEFGFYYSSKDDLLNVLPMLIALLDSRTDAIIGKEEQQAMILAEDFSNFDEYELMAATLPPDTWFQPKPKATREMLQIKLYAAKMVQCYYQLRVDFTLTRLSAFFKKYLGIKANYKLKTNVCNF